MALEELLDRLERDMEARLAELGAETNAHVARIETAAAEDEAHIAARVQAATHDADSRALGAELLELRRSARRDRLRARQRLLDRVFSRAETLVRSPEALARYMDAVATHTAEALVYAGPGSWRIRCAPPFEAQARGVAGEHEVVVDPDMPLGVQVESTDGAVVIDNTFSARMSRSRDALAIEIAREVETP